MPKLSRIAPLIVIAACLLVAGLASSAAAHGVIGQRFFPATLVIDDPFVADELSLPTLEIARRKGVEDEPASLETDISAELSKRLSRRLGLSIAGTLIVQDEDHGPTIAGFDNMELSLKYVFFDSAPHEVLLSAGVEADVGGTGQKKVGAESFSTVSPTFFFGKGMGDLPDSLRFLKPAALTGAFALNLPTEEHTTTTTLVDGELETDRELNPRVIEWGFSLQYNLQYLQSFVEDVGLSAPFNRMIPLVEFAMETSVQGSSKTAGSINPGVIWFGRYIQLGLEAVIPVNGNALDEAPQPHVGFLGQIHFYLDDIWPELFTWTPIDGVLGPTQPR
ncbi:MAG TPA: hypothetical protein VEI94_00470 [Candidatus Bathyarchaeia archaeon]|nr:hypothetical protein [Candidatus Bathyarchaeia archaeon]